MISGIYKEKKKCGLPHAAFNGELICLLMNNSLNILDLNTNNWKNLTMVSDEFSERLSYRDNLGFNVHINNDMVVIHSELSPSVYAYDINSTNEYEYIESVGKTEEGISNPRWFSVESDVGFYSIPCDNDRMSYYDKKTHEYRLIHIEWMNKIKNRIRELEFEFCSVTCGTVCNTKLYLDIYCKPHDLIAVVDLEKEDLEVVMDPNISGYFWSMVIDSDEIIVQNYDSDCWFVSCLDISNGAKKREYPLSGEFGRFTNMSVHGGMLCVFGMNGHSVLLDKQTGRVLYELSEEMIPLYTDSFSEFEKALFWNGKGVIIQDFSERNSIEIETECEKTSFEEFVEAIMLSDKKGN